MNSDSEQSVISFSPSAFSGSQVGSFSFRNSNQNQTSSSCRRPRRLNAALIMLVSACVLISFTLCSPHHRIRHSSHHHHDRDSAIKPTAIPGVPPSYLSLMYESLASHPTQIHRSHANANPKASSSPEEQPAGASASAGHNEPILRAIVPAQIAHSVETTKIAYTLSKNKLGDFNRANIILTLRDEVDLSFDGSVLTIIVTIKDFQVTHSLKIREGSKFYSFDVTKLLQNTIPDILGTLTSSEHPEEEKSDETNENGPLNEEVETLAIQCTIADQTTGTTRQFSDIFDAYTEIPFILLRFTHIHLSASGNPSHHGAVQDVEHGIIGQSRRRRRAATPTTATGIPGIGSQSNHEHANEECTCPRPSHHILPFMPPTASTVVPASQLERVNRTRPRDDEYEITTTDTATGNAPATATDFLSPLNITVPTHNKNKSSEDAGHHYSYNQVSPKHAVSKLSLTETLSRPPPPPYPSKVPPSPTVCKRHEWMVRPSDISLDDVIRPEYLDLGYCGGTCPFPLQNDVWNFTMHSYFADQHRFFNGFATPSNLPHSQCIPVTYKKLMVMMKEGDGGFVVIVFDDASVESCGCR